MGLVGRPGSVILLLNRGAGVSPTLTTCAASNASFRPLVPWTLVPHIGVDMEGSRGLWSLTVPMGCDSGRTGLGYSIAF